MRDNLVEKKEKYKQGLYKKSLSELESLCLQNGFCGQMLSKKEIINELTELFGIEKKQPRKKKQKVLPLHVVLTPIQPMNIQEKFWLIKQESEMIITTMDRYFQPGIHCKRSGFYPRFSKTTYFHFFAFKENQGKIRKTVCNKKRNGTKEKRNMIHHNWNCIEGSPNNPNFSSQKENGFPIIDFGSSRYWIKEIKVDNAFYLIFLKKLSFKYNLEDEELKITWIYDVYLKENNIWNKVQGF